MIGNNFLDIMMHQRFTGYQSYVLLCTVMYCYVLKLLILITQSYFSNQAATSIY